MYGFSDFPVWVKYTFADGKADAQGGELTDLFDGAVESVDDPGLAWTMFLVKAQDVGGGFYVMDDDGFLVLFGEEDVLFEDPLLKVVGCLMEPVESGLADGNDTVFVQQSFKDGQVGDGLLVEFPWVDAIGRVSFRRSVSMDVNKRNVFEIHVAKLTIFADNFMVMQRFKSWILPIAIVLGIFFHEYIVVLQPALPYFIFLMLYFSFNSLDVKTMRFTMFDFWLLLFQLVVSTGIYFLIRPFDETLAEGAFVTVLAPTAAAAIAVSLILGANIGMMSTYLIACNLMVAVVAPLSFTLIGASPDISFWSSFLAILGKVFPLLIAPFLLAVLTRWLLPKANDYINRHKSLSFYVWAVSLTVVISRAIGLLVNEFHEHRMMFLWMVVISVFLCFLQFFVGHLIGKRYGDRVAGGQALGQKNTVLAIWMAQSYLIPLCSLVPTLYVIWQNLYNSFQMMQKEKRDRKK